MRSNHMQISSGYPASARQKGASPRARARAPLTSSRGRTGRRESASAFLTHRLAPHSRDAKMSLLRGTIFAVMAVLGSTRDCYVEDMHTRKSGLLSWSAVPTCKELILPRMKDLAKDQGVFAIVAELQKAGDKKAQLESIDLTGNGIGPEGARALASWLNVSTKLRAIELRGNPLGDEGVSELAYGMGNSLTLTALGLIQTGASNDGAASLAASLRKTTTLEALELSYNYIGESGAKALADAVISNDMLRLTRFSIERNLPHDGLRPDIEDTARIEARIKRVKQQRLQARGKESPEAKTTSKGYLALDEL